MGKSWTVEEDNIIKKLYRWASWLRIMNSLPGRTKDAIKGRAHTLNIIRDSTRLGKYYLYARCSKHGSIHRAEILWKTTSRGTRIPTCPRPYCGVRLRMVPKNSSQKRRYRELGLMEVLKSETTEKECEA